MFSLIPVRYVVLALLCLVTVVNYVQRNAISGALTDMQKDLRIDFRDANDAVFEFFVTYALMQIPSGWLAQRWGTRRALTFFTVGWSLATGAMALAQGLPAIRGLRWLQGAFQAGIFPCATLIFAEWVPLSRRALATGLLTAFMLVGAAFSNVFTGLLIEALGWRGLMAVFALPGLAWAAFFYWWFRDRPQDHPSVGAAELALLTANRPRPGPADERPTPWLAICLSVPLILICIQQFCRAGANRLLDQHFVVYLQEAREMPIAQANYTASVPLWAAVFGSLMGGWLSDWVLTRTGSRRAARQGVAAASLATAIVLYVLAGAAGDIRVAVLAISLAFCISTFASPCAYSLILDMGGRNTAVVFGAMNMLGNLGAAACLWYGGRLRGDFHSWDRVLTFYLALHVVALACWLLVNPSGVIGDKRSSAA